MSPRDVVVQVLKNFEPYEAGQIVCVPMSEAIAHLIVENYLRLLDDPAWRE